MKPIHIKLRPTPWNYSRIHPQGHWKAEYYWYWNDPALWDHLPAAERQRIIAAADQFCLLLNRRRAGIRP